VVTRKIKHHYIFTTFLQMFYFTRNHGLSSQPVIFSLREWRWIRCTTGTAITECYYCYFYFLQNTSYKFRNEKKKTDDIHMSTISTLINICIHHLRLRYTITQCRF